MMMRSHAGGLQQQAPRRASSASVRPTRNGWRACVAATQKPSGYARSSVFCRAQGNSQTTLDLLSDLLQEPKPDKAEEASDVSSGSQQQQQATSNGSHVSAPLLKIGAGQANYVGLALRFSNVATSNQRKRGQRGVSLDFIIDTGSTVNVLNPAVARELQLPVVGVQPAGAGAGGGIAAAPIFMLGDTQLDYLTPEQRFTFMTGLQAAGLMVPSPACSGILGRAFIDQFSAVEFRFASDSSSNSTSSRGTDSEAANSQQSAGTPDSSPGSVFKSLAPEANNGNGASTSGSGVAGGIDRSSGYEIRFHQEYDANDAREQGGMQQVPLSVLGITGLWGAQMRIQGVPGAPDLVVPALIDTGAPCSILNSAAASALGLQQQPSQVAPVPAGPAGNGGSSGGGGGLLGGIGKLFGGGKGSGANVGAGSNGTAIQGGYILRPTEARLELSLQCTPAEEGGDAWASLGAVQPVIGDLPGFQALGITEGQPAAILGLDALASRPSIVLCPKKPVMLV